MAPEEVAAPDVEETAAAVVLGAGISGLAAARALRRAGCQPVVLELAAQPGGVMVTAARHGYLAELGPNTVQEAPALHALAADAGCEGELVAAQAAARRRYIVHRGRLVALPSGPPGLLTTPLLSWAGKVRLATEPWRRRGPGPEESVAAFFHRRLGRESLPFADAMGLGVFAGDPEELAIGFAFGRAYALERDHGSLLRGVQAAQRPDRTRGPRAGRRLLGFTGGFAALAQRLAAGLDIRHGWRAVAVESAGGPAAAPAEPLPPLDSRRFRVVAVASDGSRRVLVTRRLVSALPAAATAAVLAPLAGADDAGHLAAIAALPQAPVMVIALGFQRAAVSHPLDGFGFLAPHREGRRILGCLFSSSLFPDRAPEGRVLLTVMAGGRRRPEMLELSDEQLIAAACQELGDLLGIRGEPELAILRRWRPGIPQPSVAWQPAREAALRLEQQHPGLTILGSWLRGVGLPDCARAGWEIAPE